MGDALWCIVTSFLVDNDLILWCQSCNALFASINCALFTFSIPSLGTDVLHRVPGDANCGSDEASQFSNYEFLAISSISLVFAIRDIVKSATMRRFDAWVFVPKVQNMSLSGKFRS